MSRNTTELDKVKWDEEHSLFKGSFFGEYKFDGQTYTLVKGSMVGGGYSIGGMFDGEYQEFDVSTAKEMNEILTELTND